MKKIQVHLYGTIYTDKGKLGGGLIFPTYYEFTVNKKFTNKLFLELFKKENRNTKPITDEYTKDLHFKVEYKDLEWVTKTKGKWIKGEYEAHEYGEYVEGRARLIKYSNGFKEVEVECLDPNKRVLDGMWEYDGTGTLGNGCGDYFTPFERME